MDFGAGWDLRSRDAVVTGFPLEPGGHCAGVVQSAMNSDQAPACSQALCCGPGGREPELLGGARVLVETEGSHRQTSGRNGQESLQTGAPVLCPLLPVTRFIFTLSKQLTFTADPVTTPDPGPG